MYLKPQLMFLTASSSSWIWQFLILRSIWNHDRNPVSEQNTQENTPHKLHLQLLSGLCERVRSPQIWLWKPVLVYGYRVDVPVFVEGDWALSCQKLFYIILWTSLWSERKPCNYTSGFTQLINTLFLIATILFPKCYYEQFITWCTLKLYYY